MRVYLSGPMTNTPDRNRPAFDAAERRLTEQGLFVINPHRISEQFGTPEELAESFKIFYAIDGKDNYVLKEELDRRASIARAVMDADLAAVRSCDAIYLLRGWTKSRGAKKELDEALEHGLEIIEEGSAE